MAQAHVIGSGPNGLAAAITLAQAGHSVRVYEAQAVPGGAARTLPLTLPGFLHDFGSAVHPLAAGSAFFKALPLEKHGLEWIHGEVPLAHPFDDGTAVLLHRDLGEAQAELGADGKPWTRLLQPIAEHWRDFTEDALGPLVRIPRHPFLMAQFGLAAFLPAQMLARHEFKTARAQALFAGLSAHSFLSLDKPLSSAAGLVLGAAAHAVGWPIPRGGSQSVTSALIAQLQSLGGSVETSRRILSLAELDAPEAITLCDLGPRQMLSMAGTGLGPAYRRTLSRFRYGPGAFKLDYALSAPVPWLAPECRRAITVHLGGTLEQIAESEDAVARGRIPERPFALVVQPSSFDPTRAPAGKHVLWAYCHVPNGSTVDMSSRIEAQIERFAPGFRDCILARNVLSPAALEAMDENLVGGDVNGGALSLAQTILRPGIRSYATGTPNLYLCSASTPPGGGVHGMCGYHAAKLALKRLCA